jgi:hypothetical protein
MIMHLDVLDGKQCAAGGVLSIGVDNMRIIIFFLAWNTLWVV